MKTNFATFISFILLLSSSTLAQDGNLDSSFDPGTGANDAIYSTTIQSDGKIIIGGLFTSYNGTTRHLIARVNVDGSLDTSFDPGTGPYQATFPGVRTISIQSDGKIIIGGYFSTYNGTARSNIARLNTDGSLDTSFDPGTGENNSIISTSIQSDGKIIICGQLTTYDGTARNRIARLNTDGSLDTSFDPGTGASNIIWSSSIQSDGKIIIGGQFTSYNGFTRNHIARLNTDGSLDASFNPSTAANDDVSSIAIQSDGKIVISGDFTSYNGTTRNHIARLNTDGSLDTSFDPGTGANNDVRATSIHSDGKIVIAGWFTTYNGVGRNRIARLNTDGSLDTSFDPGTGVSSEGNSWVNTTSIQSNGKIIIGGVFNSYDGTTRTRIARINSTATTTEVYQLDNEFNNFIIFPNPFSMTTTLHTKIELKNATLTVYNSFGQSVKQIASIYIGMGQTIILNRDNLPAGLYIIRLSHENQIMMTDKLLITD